jgi:hypothetical protein
VKVYSKKVRAQAARICSIAASTPEMNNSYDGVCAAMGERRNRGTGSFGPAFRLALLAWDHARDANAGLNGEQDAEAEALLRTGWTPS